MFVPVSLNFDGSVTEASSSLLEGRSVFDFTARQAQLRFCSRWKDFDNFGEELELRLGRWQAEQSSGVLPLAFLGSGDYHHLSYQLIRRLRHGAELNRSGLHVVVFDNHPDNMRFVGGIHCGSWVYHASRLPHVTRVTVVGICSDDVAGFQIPQNHVLPLRSGRIRYLCLRPLSPLAKSMFGAGGGELAPDVQAQGILSALELDSSPVYLSIDKDVVSRSRIVTNWDQGVMSPETVLEVASKLRPRLAGCDVTGEISEYRYPSLWKRLLSALDGQVTLQPGELERAAAGQQNFNTSLIALLCASQSAPQCEQQGTR